MIWRQVSRRKAVLQCENCGRLAGHRSGPAHSHPDVSLRSCNYCGRGGSGEERAVEELAVEAPAIPFIDDGSFVTQTGLAVLHHDHVIRPRGKPC